MERGKTEMEPPDVEAALLGFFNLKRVKQTQNTSLLKQKEQYLKANGTLTLHENSTLGEVPRDNKTAQAGRLTM